MKALHRNLWNGRNSMNAPTTTEAIPPTAARTPGISRLVRRIHLFTGLFLAPWMVMYALSTLVMAHHKLINSFYSSKSPALIKERELDYSRSFPTNMTRDQIAQQILQDLGMEGAYDTMRHGVADEAWAKEHHEYWYRQELAKRGQPGAGMSPDAAPASSMKEGWKV